MSEERSVLRHSLLPNLLDSVAYNLARQSDSAAFYEVGSVFLKAEEHTKPVEKEHVAGAVTGLWHKTSGRARKSRLISSSSKASSKVCWKSSVSPKASNSLNLKERASSWADGQYFA